MNEQSEKKPGAGAGGAAPERQTSDTRPEFSCLWAVHDSYSANPHWEAVCD